jgi:antitoxin component of RelBE/YafQ-DinJ toxin-antitoxin module
MRQLYDTSVKFRINQRLLDEAAAKAERQGMTFAELARHALRREVKEHA